ncbi:uncharacterized protein [Amphiura filiformis]|uniref:uncharacterized protein n=1 Tax=Amphiura filiformis TaxID=82378 RepID=UPI003B20F5ED
MALRGLQSITSFAEYPPHLQDKLARTAYFYSIPSKKVIVRQGHHAETFYFLITGQAEETITEHKDKDKEPESTIVNTYEKGDSFGELEIVHNIPRKTTIAADTTCEVLAIDSEDFYDMFMEDGDQTFEFDHFKFLRTIPFTKGWPIRKLYEHPQMCMSHFFKKGSVIVRDSNNSEWLFIVKSGSCQVIKELREAKPLIVAQRVANEQVGGEKYAPNGLNIGPRIDSRRRKGFQLGPPEFASPTYITALQPATNEDIKNKTYEEKTVFVQVDMLLPKDVFGLSMMCGENGITDITQPSLSLVSRGIECIMLNKRFFMEHATAFVKQQLKEIVRPYPLQETLQKHLQTHTDWEHYKMQTLSGTLKSVGRKPASP